MQTMQLTGSSWVEGIRTAADVLGSISMMDFQQGPQRAVNVIA